MHGSLRVWRRTLGSEARTRGDAVECRDLPGRTGLTGPLTLHLVHLRRIVHTADVHISLRDSFRQGAEDEGPAPLLRPRPEGGVHRHADPRAEQPGHGPVAPPTGRRRGDAGRLGHSSARSSGRRSESPSAPVRRIWVLSPGPCRRVTWAPSAGGPPGSPTRPSTTGAASNKQRKSTYLALARVTSGSAPPVMRTKRRYSLFTLRG